MPNIRQVAGDESGRETVFQKQGETLGLESFEPPLRIRLLVLQPTTFCNISCDYCYLSSRDARRFMSLEVVEAAVANAKRCGLIGPRLSVVWHAGEPLVVPKSYYRQAFHLLQDVLGADVDVSHSIQTNGTLIDREWCELFKDFRVRIGVSLDGPPELHDLHRKTRTGRPTHAKIMQGIADLRSNQVPFHVISVVTAEALDHADAIMDFFIAQEIGEVGFNVDEQEGVNARSSLQGKEREYRTFLSRIIQRAVQERSRIEVRELTRALALISEGLPAASIMGEAFADNDQHLPFAITTVDCDGWFSCFSPELIDQQHPSYGRFVFGNVLRDSLTDALGSAAFARVHNQILAGVRLCRDSCDYYKLCGGGAPVNKLNENGRFDTTETMYCRTVVQAPISLALAQLERVLGGVSTDGK